MLLNIVTDEELLISEVVKTILLILLTVAVIYNLYRIIRGGKKVRASLNIVFVCMIATLIFFVGREFLKEAALLKNYQYVPGITKDYCDVAALGKGIEFEYEVKGKLYHNCNTLYPASLDSILVPGGKFQVRVSLKYPSEGRMDFHKHIK